MAEHAAPWPELHACGQTGDQRRDNGGKCGEGERRRKRQEKILYYAEKTKSAQSKADVSTIKTKPIEYTASLNRWIQAEYCIAAIDHPVLVSGKKK